MFKVNNPNAAKLAAIKAARTSALTAASDGAIQKFIAPAEAKDRLRFLFDDSGSMGSQVEDAKTGTIECLRNCDPFQTSVAIHFLNTKDEELATLNSNLIQVADRIKKLPLRSGGTPLFARMKEILRAEPTLTRMVVFTDGDPTDDAAEYQTPPEDCPDRNFYNLQLSADVIIAQALELKAPIDTVFFGSSFYGEQAIKFLKYLADKTGGYFLHFDPAKVSFAKAFKYLAPTNRLMLASESIRREIESGKRS